MAQNMVQSSYKESFKSTMLIGGSQVIGILLRIVKTKILAVLLGPAGVGIVGLYSAITEMVSMIADMGIGTSGVRQIAMASSSYDEDQIARTTITLRWVAIILGTFGAVAMVACALPLSRLTFGDSSHAEALAFLSVTIFFGAVATGQTALIQGMRRIDQLAMLTILGTLFSSLFSIPFVFYLGENGIVPFLIATSAASIGTSCWFARKIKVARIVMTWRDILWEARTLLKLGFVFMVTFAISSGTMYVVRIIIARSLGLDAVGQFQAASTLSTLYIGVILNAMGADFYPRLTAVAFDNIEVNRMVNEQVELGLLLALPGIVFTLAFAPRILQIFYSVHFISACEVLRWYILGIFLRVICWPMGYIIQAKGKGLLYFWTDTVTNVMHIGLAWWGVQFYGLVGVGIALSITLFFYTIMIMAVARRISGFTLIGKNRRLMLYSLSVVFLMSLAIWTLNQYWMMLVGIILTLITTYYSVKSFHKKVGIIDVKPFLRKFGIQL